MIKTEIALPLKDLQSSGRADKSSKLKYDKRCDMRRFMGVHRKGWEGGQSKLLWGDGLSPETGGMCRN